MASGKPGRKSWKTKNASGEIIDSYGLKNFGITPLRGPLEIQSNGLSKFNLSGKPITPTGQCIDPNGLIDFGSTPFTKLPEFPSAQTTIDARLQRTSRPPHLLLAGQFVTK